MTRPPASRRLATGLAPLLALLLLAMPALAQTRVALKTSARTGAGQPVTIGDIAELNGPQGEAIGAITLDGVARDAGGAWTRVDAETIRKAIGDAGIDLRLVAVSGSGCTIRFTGSHPGEATAEAEAAPEAGPQPVDLAGPPTVRTGVGVRLAGLLGVGPQDLKLRFKDEDASFLSMSTVGRRVSVQPASNGMSERVPVRVMLFTGDRVLADRTIQVELLVRRTVVTASRTISRHEELSGADVVESVRWLAPSGQSPASIGSILGAEARGRISAGQIIERADIEPPVVCRKGDVVVVHVLCGGVHVEVRARAMGTARDGENVELRLEDRRKSFTARMNGRGRAVMVTGAAPGAPANTGTNTHD